MKGQFGLDLQGGPGSIYKVDGRTGVVDPVRQCHARRRAQSGPGLGNLAYDAAHKQLFVSDLYTGMIHRFDLDGNELGRYDHGVAGLAAAKLAPVPFNPANRPNIASARFDSEKPDDLGLRAAGAPGLGPRRARGPALLLGGGRTADLVGRHRARRQLRRRSALGTRRPGASRPLPVSDIAFSHNGAMILAQRALIAGAYDYSAFTRPASRACCAIG